MSTRTILLALVALLFAGATAFFVRDRMQAERPEPAVVQVQAPPKPVKKVLVAKVDLPAGLLLQEEHLRWQSWPDDAIDAAYVPEEGTDLAKFYGAVVRRGIAAGQPVTEGRIARPGDKGFLAAVLKPGMRAVSIAINETTSAGSLIYPGDRVDVLLSHVLPVPAGSPEGTPAHRATETVFENVRILALDQVINDQNGPPIRANVATIEVTPKQAEMIAVLTQVGSLSLALRSLAEPGSEAAPQTGDDVAAVARGLGAVDQAASDGVAVGSVLRGAIATAAAGAGSEPPASPAADPLSVWADNPAPERGVTYTIDNDVSRLIAAPLGGKEKRKVSVTRGAASETVEFE